MKDPQLNLIKSIAKASPEKIVLVVLDGLGGLPDPDTGRTELETARTPNLDRLAAQGICGLINPVAPGITPGSAPGHLSLFGYEPTLHNVGRGVLEAMGIGIDLGPGDVAARGNFCTVDSMGLITDRRAGRIGSEQCAELCRLLDGQEIDGVKISAYPVREHRLVVLFRGEGLEDSVDDSDPQQPGVAPKLVTALNGAAGRLAGVANAFLTNAAAILADQYPANMVLLRGFARHPNLPEMQEVYRLNPAVIASYPMYRGLARLVGMNVLETGPGIDDEFDTLEKYFGDYDFFFMHIKGTDSAGEDGDFNRKVSVIEHLDIALARLLNLYPDVIVVTGDHSTPALLKGHSWHPVPALLYSPWCRPDSVKEFGETACGQGGLGCVPGISLMPLALANAHKLDKYGA
jgi:2,3-bisphosphoglycerate-independent phosphoglycerate mutase